ncbi:MAG: Crp/Fnr family transcriptional regulator [Candidatus Glassbacteria bacterium]
MNNSKKPGEKKSLIPVLRHCSLFSDCDEESLEQIIRVARVKHLERGEILFLEGRDVKGFYVLLSGRVKLYKSSADGREQILHLIAPYESFAEASLFSGEHYPATASALAPSKVVFFPKDSFLKLLEKDSRICLNIIASLAKWLRKMTALAAELSLKNVESRLAAYIIELCRKGGIPLEDGAEVKLEVEKRELALLIGTVSETLSRTLKRLIERGLIRVDGKVITIIDSEKFSGLLWS